MNNITQVNMIHHNNYHKFSQENSKVAGNVTSSNLNQLFPFIKLPYPPTIRASDIAKKRIRSKICSKSPNAFFVYRKAFVDQLSNLTGKNKLKMTEVSRLVSSHWKLESKQVKDAYEEIAKQVEQELNNIRNKDLVYTDDFDIGRKKRKNKRGRRSEFGCDAFFKNLKGNFNISTLDFSVKPSNNNDNNNNSDNNNSNCNSSFSSPSLSSSSSQDSVNYEENNEENKSSDELSTQEITTTFENNDNDNNVNNQPLQQNYHNLEEFPNYHSPISDELICDDSNLLTPPNSGSELDNTLYNNYNDYIIQYPQNEFNLYESFLKNNEISTPNYPYPVFEDRGLDYYLGYFDNLS
jgi:hypothetical protein